MSTLPSELNQKPSHSDLQVKPRLHLDYLDGIRGLAALYVVMSHLYGEMMWSYQAATLSPAAVKLIGWLNYGHFSVVVFIVLSGYCLMLPVARSKTGAFPGGSREYFKRRAWRILPPYYAALALTLLLISLTPAMHTITAQRVAWDSALPALTLSAVLPHILLIHNLNPSWIYKINISNLSCYRAVAA